MANKQHYVLVTGMFTPLLVCIGGKRKQKHKVGVLGTDTAEQTNEGQQENRSVTWLGSFIGVHFIVHLVVSNII